MACLIIHELPDPVTDNNIIQEKLPPYTSYSDGYIRHGPQFNPQSFTRLSRYIRFEKSWPLFRQI